MDDNPNIVETYANADNLETASIVVGFEEDKTAWIRGVEQEDDDVWGVWTHWGSSVDYTSNEAFAALNGCPFKVDNMPSQDTSA